jgi:hypothetical protein
MSSLRLIVTLRSFSRKLTFLPFFFPPIPSSPTSSSPPPLLFSLPLSALQIREVSIKIAVSVIRTAQKLNVDRNVELRDKTDAQLLSHVQTQMYHPLLNAEEQGTR